MSDKMSEVLKMSVLSSRLKGICSEVDKLPQGEQKKVVTQLVYELGLDAEFTYLHKLATIKQWKVPPEIDGGVFGKATWIGYWNACVVSEDNPEVGRPVVPHRSGGGS